MTTRLLLTALFILLAMAACSPSSTSGPSGGDWDYSGDSDHDSDSESTDGELDSDADTETDGDGELEPDTDSDSDVDGEAQVTAFAVDAAGGSFESGDGVQLVIPAGALDAPVTILVDSVADVDSGSVTVVSEIWRFRPSGLRFLMPITVTLPFDAATAGEGPFTMYWTEPDSTDSFAAVSGTTVFDDSASASVSHFSMGMIGLLRNPPIDGDSDLDDDFEEGDSDAVENDLESDLIDSDATDGDVIDSDEPDGDLVDGDETDSDWETGDIAIDDICTACLSEDDCASGICLTLPDGQFCSADCRENACPAPFTCRQLGLTPASPWRCLPPTGACSCYRNDQHGAARTCYVGNQWGVCLGRQDCDSSMGWTPCDAAQPAEDVCDGADNNCDGQTDEGVPDDACLAVGVCGGSDWICAEENYVCQYPDTYEAELELSCDGLDNDCDGSTDEFLDAPPTDNQRGVCAGAEKVCGGPTGWVNYYLDIPGYQPDETLCDGLDNDCDGATDEAASCR